MAQSFNCTVRLYIEGDFHAGAIFTLSASQSHYITNVMRLGMGAKLALFNGKDGQWSAVIIDITRKAVSVRLKQQTLPQLSEPDIWLLFAPIKFGRIDFLVQKATELGVSRLLPVQTRRTIVKRVNHNRLKANIIEAAEQSQRLTIPELAEYCNLQQCLANWPANRRLIYGDETGKGQVAKELLPQFANQPLAVLIGPEGGFSAEELELLRSRNDCYALSLGRRILRADTAALAALSALMMFCGDW